MQIVPVPVLPTGNVLSPTRARPALPPVVVLFVSDMHFGAEPEDVERRKERDLIRCLRTMAEDGEAIDHLYLVGDVFDGYLEYRHLVPKGTVRFQSLLADWTDAGVPVTYLIGNHDPWHRDYFASELGVRVVETVDAQHDGWRVRIEHGDAVGSTHSLYPALRPLLRHPLPVTLYRSLLPADLGIGLARWISEAVRDEEPDPELVAELEAHARDRIAGGTDLVVMGHCHVPTLQTPLAEDDPSGAYLNTGSWFGDRTVGRLDDGCVELLRWNGTRAVSIEATRL
jgi:UDP-2,3-diacylglucosamine hydrolase